MRKTIVITSAIMLVGMISVAGLWGCKSESATQPIAQSHSDRSLQDNSAPFDVYSIATTYGQVDVVGVEPVPDEKLVRLWLMVHRGTLGALERTLTVQLAVDASNNLSFQATLGSDAITPLWQLEYIVSGDNAGSTSTILRSAQDSLVATRAETADGIIESYLANGDLRTYQLAFGDMARAKELYNSGLVDGHFKGEAIPDRKPADKQLIYMLQDCQAFYDRTSLLRITDEAGLTDQLLQNDKVIHTIKANIGTADDQQLIEKWWKKLCAGAAVCTYIACEFFPPNAVCATCGVVAFGCAIYELFRD